jgi:hypothetical protein
MRISVPRAPRKRRGAQQLETPSTPTLDLENAA